MFRQMRSLIEFIDPTQTSTDQLLTRWFAVLDVHLEFPMHSILANLANDPPVRKEATVFIDRGLPVFKQYVVENHHYRFFNGTGRSGDVFLMVSWSNEFSNALSICAQLADEQRTFTLVEP